MKELLMSYWITTFFRMNDVGYYLLRKFSVIVRAFDVSWTSLGRVQKIINKLTFLPENCFAQPLVYLITNSSSFRHWSISINDNFKDFIKMSKRSLWLNCISMLILYRWAVCYEVASFFINQLGLLRYFRDPTRKNLTTF